MYAKEVLKAAAGSLEEMAKSIRFTFRQLLPKLSFNSEPEFHQAVFKVAQPVFSFIETHPEYKKANMPERKIEPERVVLFPVPWMDDTGN